jgi:DNA mismatch repair ATPase MutS
MRMESEDASQPLAFDYRLKPGVVQQRNGMAIARMTGIEENV